ncbi:predicted protein [Culex quinquefasciatus]|uniref:Predicted protein n=1 Tax=Culex quinquefasciatus TaxID=7176 RepID=B0XII1_CULQU|nr:predicted protein [Culex quinquefasciatus]|eukprot:XP_001869453.1 predicted protein [Culex quinquefasciatus]
MSSSNLDQTSTLCGACRFLTEAEEIITCSSCRMAYHSRCVDNTAADTEWYCPEGCRNNPDDSAEQAREQPDAATEMDCPAVEQVEEFDAERWIREKQKEIEMELAERQAQIDRELREKEENMTEAIRKVMRRQEANLELERKKKANHERRMAELQNSFKWRSSIIDEQLELTKFGFEKILQRPQIVNMTNEEKAGDENIEREESSSEMSEDSDGSSKSSAKNTDESGAKLKRGFKEDSTSPDRANEKQQVACHDHQLRFCAEIAKLSDDERIKIIAKWEPGGDVLFNQSDADVESHILVALPVASAVLIGNFSSAIALVVGLAPDQRHRGCSPTSDVATAVALIDRSPAVRPGLGTVQGILTMQQTTEAHRTWQRSTLLNGLDFAVSVTCGNGVEANDDRFEGRFGDLRWMQPAGIAASGQHQAPVKDPDKPNDHSQLQDSMASAQQGPADTDRVEFRRRAENNLWRQAQVDDFPEEQNLPQSGSELRDDTRDHQCAGREKGGGTPLRHTDIGLLATKSCKMRDNDVHENATHGVAYPRILVVSSTVDVHKQMDPERVLGSTAKVGVGRGGDAGSAFVVDITAVNRIVEENLLGLGVQKLTKENGRTTTASVVKTERFVTDINNNQRSVHEQSHQTEEASQLEQKSSANTAVLEDLLRTTIEEQHRSPYRHLAPPRTVMISCEFT